MYCNLRTTILLVCGFLFTQSILANSEDTQQPITIEADRAELNELKETSIYMGNVILRQGGIEIKADIVSVYAIKGNLQRITADGKPARYTQNQDMREKIHGVSKRMEYETESKRLLLLDGAELWQGKNRFSGERIQYDPREQKVIATGGSNNTEQGGKRVQITLQPQSSKPDLQNGPAGKP